MPDKLFDKLMKDAYIQEAQETSSWIKNPKPYLFVFQSNCRKPEAK